MGGTTFHLSPGSKWPDSASCNVCCRGACAKRLFCSRVLAAAKEEIDVEKSSDRRGNHEITCFRSEFVARYPSRSDKRGVEQPALWHLAAVPCSDYEKLAEIERRMPADRPPKRTRDANADAKDHAKSEYYSDVDCVFVRLGQVRDSKHRSRAQCRGPETGCAPVRRQRVPGEGL